MRRTLVVLIAFALGGLAVEPVLATPGTATTPVIGTTTGTDPDPLATPAARGGSVVWTPSSFLAGTGTVGVSGKAPKKVVKVRRRGGKVRKHPVRRAIALQVQTSTGWITLDKGRTSKKGAYSLSDP